jgi:hypothetical protein
MNPYAQLNLTTGNQTLNLISGDIWLSTLHCSEGNHLYRGTSINGGAFFVQSTSKPSANSTMMTLHQQGGINNPIPFDFNSTNSSSTISIAGQTISIDWDVYNVSIDK